MSLKTLFSARGQRPLRAEQQYPAQAEAIAHVEPDEYRGQYDGQREDYREHRPVSFPFHSLTIML